jgi:hypothetical protein
MRANACVHITCVGSCAHAVTAPVCLAAFYELEVFTVVIFVTGINGVSYGIIFSVSVAIVSSKNNRSCICVPLRKTTDEYTAIGR